MKDLARVAVESRWSAKDEVRVALKAERVCEKCSKSSCGKLRGPVKDVARVTVGKKRRSVKDLARVSIRKEESVCEVAKVAVESRGGL